MSTTVERKWSEQQKLAIIQEVRQQGVTETMRKYNHSHSLYRKWRKAYDGQGACRACSHTTKP